MTTATQRLILWAAPIFISVYIGAFDQSPTNNIFGQLGSRVEKADITAQTFTRGKGAPQNTAEAAKRYRKAAEQGDPYAQVKLGSIYAEGDGVTKDATEALKWYHRAAEQGFADAQFRLGAMYTRGEGVPRDSAEGAKWYLKAAEQGHAIAQLSLGGAYALGNGVAKDAAEATKWWRRSAEQGFTEAQFFLGTFYSNGYVVPQDYVEAYKWLNLAAAQGSELAAKARDRLEDRMTSGQISEAQRLSREFRPVNNSTRAAVNSDLLNTAPNDDAIIGTGSGFFITPDGYIVTGAHVVEGGTSFKVLAATGLMLARLVRYDEANDLAVLKVEGQWAALPIAPSRAVRLGESVAAIGFPNVGLQGFSPKLARGEISSLAGAQDDARHFQISVPVQPGNSGGPLVDLKGNVVGVIIAKLNQRTALARSGSLAENVNYAVKSGFLLSFLESLPAVIGQLPEVRTHESKFEDMVAMVERATVLVLVFR